MTRSEPMQWTAHLPAGTEPSGVDVLAGESLPRAWVANWARDPSAIVALLPDGSRLGAAELEDRSRMVAGRLASLGLVPGDRVILSASASLELLVSYVALHRLGTVIVPMNSSYGPQEIAHIVTNTSPKAAIVDDSHRGELIRQAAGNDTLPVLGCDVAVPTYKEPITDLANRSTPALICHTSGTTGVPKGAVLSSGNLLASAEAIRIAWRWTPEDRLALTLPLFHLHGLGVGLNGTLLAGASVILLDHFDANSLAEQLTKHSATLFFGVPTMYHRLVQSDSASAALRALRLCVSGSAPLPSDLHRAFLVATGQAILERYGMTETVMNLSNPYDGERRAGTVGFPLPGVDMRLSEGTEGEIQLRGPNVFEGYWARPEATAEVFTADGWFRSGDLGAIDDEGYVHIVGRSKELIISGGYNVYPREVEDVLRAHLSVADVAVIGAPSEEWGETVTALVVANGAVSPQDLLDFAASRLAPYKRPRAIRFVHELPRNALGKVVRDQLAAT
jgi:malonyl-CoA/methylmalonyl-CoA synthetase